MMAVFCDATDAQRLRPLLSDAPRPHLIAAVQAVMTQWAQGWLPNSEQPHEHTIDCTRAQPQLGAWFTCAADLWMAQDAALQAVVQRWLFEESSHGRLAQTLAEKALADLRQSLVTALCADEAAPIAEPRAESLPAPHLRAWSGAFQLRLRLDEAALQLHLGPQRCARWRDETHLASPAAQKKIAPLSEVLAQQKTRLRVELAPLSLSLASLQSLNQGDVIRLEHPLDQALDFKSAAGEKICSAYLGQVQGHKAIELA